MTATPSVRRRPAEAVDAAFLLEVYASSRAEELAPVPWTEDQKRAFLDAQARAQDAEYRSRFPDAAFDVVEVGGVPAGRLYIARLEDEIHIIDIALLPEFRGRGVGARLVRRLAAEAERAGLPVRHMVFQLNEGAMRFYERLGFTRLELHGAYWEMEKRPSTAGRDG